MSTTPYLDQLDATISDVTIGLAAEEYAHSLALGVFVDDPGSDTPGVVVIVYQRKIFSINLSDAYAHHPVDEASTIINGVILNAINAWDADYERLLAYANNVIDTHGTEHGIGILNNNIENL